MKATGSSPLRRMTSLTMLLSLAIAACVAPAPAPTPVPTNTHSATPLPTSTFTPSPTPTFTVTPTPDPEQIAEALGLPFENGPSPYKHSYRIEGDNLMDYLAPIPAIAAQRVDGEWRAVTDDTVKYGALADSLGREVLGGMDLGGGDMAHVGDGRYRKMMINVVFTGKWVAADWLYPRTGEIIKDYRAIVVYPDGNGGTKSISVSVCSPDINGKILYRYKSGGGNYGEPITCDESLTRHKPGQKWVINFVHKGPDLGLVDGGCYDNGVCREDDNKLMYLRLEQKENLRVFSESFADSDLDSTIVPDGLVIPPNFISVYSE